MPEAPNPQRHAHPYTRVDLSPCGAARGEASAYAELAVTSNFTFLTGASHPEELVRCAVSLGHCVAAIADTNTLGGIVRAHVAAEESRMPLAIGCRLRFTDPDTPDVLVFPTNRAAYGRLCRLLTIGKRRADKGECHLELGDLCEHEPDMLAVVMPRTLDDALLVAAQRLRDAFGDRVSIAASRDYGPNDRARLTRLAALSDDVRVPLTAVNDVLYHHPQRRALQDVLTCIRHGCTIEQAGYRLCPNAERHLKPPDEMARLFAGYEHALIRSVEIAQRASAFSLDELRYEYPDEVVPRGSTPMRHLAELTWIGAGERYPEGTPAKVRAQIEHELRLIDELRYAPYFLTCHDIVCFARSRGILCQGRGAAANSAVCYCLGVTSVDPSRIDVLFERFVSRERNEPPDIDIDFEHERREEVIQYIYGKYGRDRAALTAEVITYRGRSAVRDVGKAMGLSLDCVDALAKSLDWWDAGGVSPERLRELGVDARDATVRRVIALTGQILGFPRHRSQHVGGFVMTRGPLCESVPIENAAMPDRTVIEWDKDDIDAVGMLKVDVLGLGMLTCIRRAFHMIEEWGERRRDEERERRRDEQTQGRREQATGGWMNDCCICKEHGFTGELIDGERQNFQGSCRMAEGQGVGQGCVPCHGTDAACRAVRIDASDAPGGGVDPVQHRRGIWKADTAGPASPSADCTRISQRTGDPDRTGDGTGHAQAQSETRCADGRNRSRHARTDPKPSEAQSPHRLTHPTSSLRLSPTSSLRLSPTSSLRLSPTSSLRLSPTSSLRLSPTSSLQLHTVPPEDPAVYDMICKADTIGVFQIESRAQMSMLPRLRPRCFYDLVIEVAIVRPGPIQGDMVHPYLRRRNGQETITYPHPDVERVLGKTLGVPLFQEQAMQLAIVAGGFTPGEADQLRRAMAAWKRKGDAIARFGEKLIGGMIARGYPPDFAQRCFEQIKGFSEYGFPESHAASFALLVYVSAYLKRHHPAAFAAALINSQPMGFYAPSQIVRDAKEHGVEVLPIDVNHSMWDCTLEERHEAHESTKPKRGSDPRGHDGTNDRASWGCDGPALRLGMRLVHGLRQADADAVAGMVLAHGPFRTIEALHRTTGVRVASLRSLAKADAFGSLGLDRQAALWHVRAMRNETLPLFDAAGDVSSHSDRNAQSGITLPPVPAPDLVRHDYAATGLSLKAHPIAFLREYLARSGATPSAELANVNRWPTDAKVAVAGIVTCRQRPATASGILFMTIEDETGFANLIVRPRVYERFRRAVRHSTAILAHGHIERQGEVVHIIVARMASLDSLQPGLATSSRDFH